MFKFRMLLVSMLLFVFCCPFVSFAQIDEAAMMENARSNYQEGGYYYATTWLERILKSWPDTPKRQEVLLMMSKAYAATGREEKALTTVRALLKDFPHSADKLDPVVVKYMQEIEARKTGPYSTFEPLGLPAAPAPAAKAVAEPAAAPAIAAAAEVATPVTATPLPAPTVKAETPPDAAAAASAPVVTKLVENEAPVAVAAPAPAQEIAAPAEPAIVEAPVEAGVPAGGAAAAPPVAVSVPLVAEKVAAAEPPISAPVAAEPAVDKAPVEAGVPVQVEIAAPPVAVSAPLAAENVAAAEPPAESKPVSQTPNLAEAFGEEAKPDSGAVFTLDLGEYVGKNTLAGAKKLVRKAGLKPLVGPGPKRVENMLRIQVGEFAEREAAQKFQKKLSGVGAKHFILVNKQGSYRVFAGSYFDHAAAVTEQKRLAALGIKSELKQVTVPVPTFVLTAGGFPNEKSASDTMAELERLGLKGKVLPAK